MADWQKKYTPPSNGTVVDFDLTDRIYVVPSNGTIVDFAFISATNVSQILSVSYMVSNAITQSVVASYDVIDLADQDLSASYHVKNNVLATLPASYDLILCQSLSASYDIHVGRGLSASYHVKNKILATLPASYDLILRQSLSASYDIHVSRGLSASYHIKSKVLATLPASYDLILRQSLSASYDIRVSRSLSASYRVKNKALATLPASYDLILCQSLSVSYDIHVSQDLSASYHVKNKALATLPASYDLILRQRLSASYDIHVGRGLSASYHVKNKALATLPASYDLILRQRFTASYDLRISRGLSASYHIKSKVLATLPASYDLILRQRFMTAYGINVSANLPVSYKLGEVIRGTLFASYDLILRQRFTTAYGINVSANLPVSYKLGRMVDRALFASYDLILCRRFTTAYGINVSANLPVSYNLNVSQSLYSCYGLATTTEGDILSQPYEIHLHLDNLPYYVPASVEVIEEGIFHAVRQLNVKYSLVLGGVLFSASYDLHQYLLSDLDGSYDLLSTISSALPASYHISVVDQIFTDSYQIGPSIQTFVDSYKIYNWLYHIDKHTFVPHTYKIYNWLYHTGNHALLLQDYEIFNWLYHTDNHTLLLQDYEIFNWLYHIDEHTLLLEEYNIFPFGVIYQTPYNIGIQNQSQEFKYDVIGLINKDLNESYTIKGRQFSATYTVGRPVISYLTATYWVEGYAKLVALYHIGRPGYLLYPSYDIINHVSATLGIKYHIWEHLFPPAQIGHSYSILLGNRVSTQYDINPFHNTFLRRPIVASSYYTGHEGGKGVDGDDETYWETRAYGEQSAKITLEHIAHPVGISIRVPEDFIIVPQEVEIWVSLDGFDWEWVGSISDNQNRICSINLNARPAKQVKVVIKECRYIEGVLVGEEIEYPEIAITDRLRIREIVNGKLPAPIGIYHDALLTSRFSEYEDMRTEFGAGHLPDEEENNPDWNPALDHLFTYWADEIDTAQAVYVVNEGKQCDLTVRVYDAETPPDGTDDIDWIQVGDTLEEVETGGSPSVSWSQVPWGGVHTVYVRTAPLISATSQTKRDLKFKIERSSPTEV